VTDARQSEATRIAPVIERTEIDGIPIFWTPVDGPRMASVQFRVGRADEPAHQAGITHLVEHLALAPLAQQDYSHNGFVAAVRTVFHASGTDAQLVDFVGAIGAALESLPLDRVLMERRILTQEAASRGQASIAMLRWYRYGNVAHGLLAIEELGLGWLGPEPIQQWVRSRFTRGNVAIWWSGPPPSDLKLDLPVGDRQSVPEPVVIAGISFPSRADLGGAGASMGYVAPRSAATRITLNILERRVRHELRFERGLIYDVATDYDPQGADDAHVGFGMDCRREDATAVTIAFLRILDDLIRTGPSEEEVRREAATFADGATHTGGRFGFLDAATHDHLVGRVRERPTQVVEEYLGTTPDDIKVAAKVAQDSLLVLAPPGPYDDNLRPYPMRSDAVVDGRTIRPTGWVIGPRARKDKLVIGPTGVSIRWPGDVAITVRYEDCVALRHWDGPIRELWSTDGFRVVVKADDWRGGTKVVEEIDAALPTEIIACGEHGLGGLEMPPDGGELDPSSTTGTTS
jgi:zinc protease